MPELFRVVYFKDVPVGARFQLRGGTYVKVDETHYEQPEGGRAKTEDALTPVYLPVER